ncbi:hypothetical protein [Enorma phocaeensis]|uniref:hypothetical protein n=1 Tax=Enorma phocaeensis TaxID=1871019 RepID=UPI0011AF2F7E|nr:hypothetical protein [Enorma phocaeensis]
MPNNADRKARGREGLAVREGRLTRRREPDSFDPGDYFVPSGEGGCAGGPSRANVIVAIVLIVLALISAFPVRIHFSSPDAFEHTIEKLDDKRNTVLGLTTAATGASVALTAIPDDVGTPVAEKLMDLSGDLLVVLTAIYLEKYLLTVFSVLSFGFLIPLALAALAAYALFQHRVPLLHALPRLAVKVLLMGVLLVATVPTSVAITDMIDHTYDISVSLDSQAEGGKESGAGDTEDSDSAAAATSGSASTDGGSSAIDDSANAETEDNGTWIEQGWEFISGIPEALANGASQVTDAMLTQLGNLVDGFAVMIVTSCVVPLGVLAFYLWAANLITGISVEVPMRALRPRSFSGREGSAGSRALTRKQPRQHMDVDE